LSTKFGLEDYVLEMVNKGEGEYFGGKPLLAYAVEFLIHRRYTVYPPSSPSFVRALLESGQDPNLIYLDFKKKEQTPWLDALKLVREALRRDWIQEEGSQRWVEILRIFVEGGADIDAVIVADTFDPEIKARGVIDAVLEKFNIETLIRLREMMGKTKPLAGGK
jgi:hypothetical protein